MRKIIIGLFLMTFGVILSTGLFAQPLPTPPAPPDTKGTNGNQAPPLAPTPSPLEPGTGILLLMAAVYGMKKLRDTKRT